MNMVYKLVIKPIRNKNNNVSFSYLIEFSKLRHGRLVHVTYGTLQKLINMNNISALYIDLKHKYEIRFETKLTRSSFESVKGNTKRLDLIHIDI